MLLTHPQSAPAAGHAMLHDDPTETQDLLSKETHSRGKRDLEYGKSKSRRNTGNATSYYCICVLILPSSYYCICVLILPQHRQRN
jgi:hypothetical protein